MSKRWVAATSVSVPDALQQAVGGHPIVARTLVRRGFADPVAAKAFLDPAHYQPASPFDLPDMDVAVERIQHAVDNDERIGVWGDFDVDGQTSTALLISALQDLGAKTTSYIPHRQREGHGVHIASLKAHMVDAGVSLVITCDTGVDAHEAVEYANEHGVDVIVTDHHKIPATLPPACAVVNPRRLPEAHPLRHLPGVGVAYKVIEALYGNERSSEHLLDLVALGIVSDVAVQHDDTRYLLQRGLEALKHTKRLGLTVMMDYAEVIPETITEDDIGFRLGPRLNALGRLDDANASTELLTTTDLERARILANQLEALNMQRRSISKQIFAGAQAQIEAEPGLLKHAALVLGHSAWHSGVVGIVANQLVEVYHKPVLLLVTPDGNEFASGSARSIYGCDITDAIAENAHLLDKFGGHTMAAGVRIPRANIEDFRRGLSASVIKQLRDQDTTPTLEIDRDLSLTDLTLPVAEDIARLAPFGPGNPPLTFATRDLEVVGQRQLGRDGSHLALTVQDRAGHQGRVVWWGADEPPEGRFDLAYTLRVNTFRGEREAQIEWLDYHVLPDPDADPGVQREAIQFVDCRDSVKPEKRLEKLLAEKPDAVVYAEALANKPDWARKRDELSRASTLVVWTTPPDSTTWEMLLDTVRPDEVVLFAQNPPTDDPQSFLTFLAALVKYTLSSKDGTATVADLAATAGQREAGVIAGLEWLAAKGNITFEIEADQVRIQRGGRKDTMLVKRAMLQVKKILAETESYRRFWQRADTANL